jgi:hypothetical protein
MPINAVKEFYNSLNPGIQFKPEKQIQWLIDTPARLEQYGNLQDKRIFP